MLPFDSAMDIMDRRMAKHKNKLLKRNKSRDSDVSFGEKEAAAAADDEPYELVRTKSYEMKPMSEQEAILNMEVLGHEFYMFFNIEENKLCTVYKRNDGRYGMIVPQ